MDFISIAEGSHRFLRQLVEDDDFSKIENDGKESFATAVPQQGAAIPFDANVDSAVNGNQPLLSPTAEAELFLLATNFLLCKFI